MTDKSKLITAKILALAAAGLIVFFLKKINISSGNTFYVLAVIPSPIILAQSWNQARGWIKILLFHLVAFTVILSLVSYRDETKTLTTAIIDFGLFFFIALLILAWYKKEDGGFFQMNYEKRSSDLTKKEQEKKLDYRTKKALFIIFSITALIIGLISYFL